MMDHGETSSSSELTPSTSITNNQEPAAKRLRRNSPLKAPQRSVKKKNCGNNGRDDENKTMSGTTTTTTADDWKAKGNAALQAGKTSEAIDFYTQAINADGSNHVYYSNRSAAYLKQHNAELALEDAEACLGLNPNFAKGHSRKGAALHALHRYNDSIAAYQEGLAKFPSDAGLQNGLASVRKEKDGPPMSASSMPGGGGGGMGGGGMSGLADLFSEQMVARMMLDPKLRPYLSDPDVMSKIKMVQSNRAMLPAILQDAKMMELLTVMMGGDAAVESAESTASAGPNAAAPSESSPAKKADSAPKNAETAQPKEEEEEEEDDSNLSPEELEKKKRKKEALEAKARGNDLYKSKKLDEALAAYDEAIQLDPITMTFYSNKAAVYFTKKDYAKCIELCEKAVEVGKANMAPFEDRAKALTRSARAHQKQGNLTGAINKCKEAQLEHYDKDTQRLLKTLELEKKKADALAYQDESLAEEAKQKGNDHFRNQEWSSAVAAYEEAVKRAPKNAAIRNNLSAALCKIMDFNGARLQIEKAVELDPQYVKAWARKGDIEVMLKENHKALESYRKGLELDPEHAACREGLRKVNSMMMATGSESERKERAEHAMADPEIQAILTDPVIRQILQDFQDNPTAAQHAMTDPGVRGKIEKLIASGVVSLG